MKGLSMKPQDRQQSIDELYRDLYGVYPDEKDARVQSSGSLEPHVLRDGDGRLWFGEYPMNEITGASVTSDLIYAEYDKDDVAVIGGERYLRLPVVRNKENEMDIFSMMRGGRQETEISEFRYFKFNMLSWRVVASRGDRVTLQSEYIIDYRAFDQQKYLKMNDKEISRIKTGIYWEKSKIREWLNSVFVRRTFREEERSLLQVTKVSTPVSALSERITYDKVYLPSIEEIRYGFDTDISLMRGSSKAGQDNELAPCSQYVAALANDRLTHSSYGLRSRGHVDQDDSYKCAENFEGHALVDNRLRVWRLNKAIGIRPVICVNADDIRDMN